MSSVNLRGRRGEKWEKVVTVFCVYVIINIQDPPCRGMLLSDPLLHIPPLVISQAAPWLSIPHPLSPVKTSVSVCLTGTRIQCVAPDTQARSFTLCFSHFSNSHCLYECRPVLEDTHTHIYTRQSCTLGALHEMSAPRNRAAKSNCKWPIWRAQSCLCAPAMGIIKYTKMFKVVETALECVCSQVKKMEETTTISIIKTFCNRPFTMMLT